MPLTFLKIIQPYLLRYLAKRVAEYLEDRRERRLADPADETPSVSAEPSEIAECPPSTAGFSSGDVIWFSLSGILVGSALGYGLAYLMKEE